VALRCRYLERGRSPAFHRAGHRSRRHCRAGPTVTVAPAALPVVWTEAYEVDIGPHVFPTRKYRLIVERLVAEGALRAHEILRPTPASDDQVALIHESAFLHKIKNGSLSTQEELVLEVPFSTQLRDAMWLCAGGSLLTARCALTRGLAVHIGGGFHHAFPDHGEGFCLINDVAIAVRAMIVGREIERAAVVDCDVHHGNGTAAIFADDPAVFTFSIHQEHNYPAWKPPSDVDIGLEDGAADEEYHDVLRTHLPRLVEGHRPDLVFYLAGADPYREDQLGGLALTVAGLRERDRLVFQTMVQAGVPVAVVLAGGYARHQSDTVEIHCNTIREAMRWTSRHQPVAP